MVVGGSEQLSSRYAHLTKSFRLGVRPLLTAFSKQDVEKAFPMCSKEEAESIYRVFVQVIKSLHQNVEEEFESICQETKVSSILDKVEQLVEEHNLDVLSTDKTNLGDVKEKLSQAKKDEIDYLTSLLAKCEEQNKMMKDRIASLRERRDASVDEDAIKKFRSWNSDFERSLA